jgi:Mg2+-importing ATPase
MSAAQVTGKFWQASVPELLESLSANPDGLKAEEATRRLARDGRNALGAAPQFSIILKVLGRFRNPLVLVLLFAACISALTGDVPSFVIILSMVVLSVVLDSVQEFRAEQAAEQLKVSVALNEQVLRDGREVTIRAEDIVRGDIVLLSAGDLVPADGRLLDANHCFINEALLTGESYPTEKKPSDTGIAGETVADATNSAFMGTSVVSGSARLLVCATGKSTQLGDISQALRHTPPPAALERGTYEFGLLIVRITVLLVLFVLLVNILLHRPLLESFLFALALAVGLTPELLPMITSVTLARGALRMAAERVIVKRLASIHDLGSMDVLCTDKTGTLTDASISLAKTIGIDGADRPRVLDLARLNSLFQSGVRSPLDTALIERAPVPPSGWTKRGEVPFDFERRRVSVLVDGNGKHLLILKGAPEDVLQQCMHYETDADGKASPMDASARTRANEQLDALGRDGLRALSVAWRDVPVSQDAITREDERDLIFAGFAVFNDPPKESAGRTVAALDRTGIAIKILTGDTEPVTRHVCTELGIPVTGVITGTDLASMSEDALGALVEETNLFCRVTPMQKNRIILALQRRGHVVGYMGDGINDAPSLHTADVGISVAGAVDVAKDAADIILLDRDLGVLERGVREGRRTFGNIMKYVMMGTSSSFGNMFSMAGASVFLPFLPMLPTQVLLNNLLYDLSEMPIPLDEVDEEEIINPRHWDMSFIRNFMLVLGPVSSLFDFLTFGLLIWVFRANEALFQTGWFVESLATQVLVIFVIRTRRYPFKSRPHPLLIVTSLAVVAIAVALPYTSLGAWFGFAPLPLAFLAALAGMVAIYLVLAEFVKRWFYRRQPPIGVMRAPVMRSGLPLSR